MALLYHQPFSSIYAGLSTVGYTVYNTNGTVYQARTTTGVFEGATADYGVYYSPSSPTFIGYMVFDTGTTPTVEGTMIDIEATSTVVSTAGTTTVQPSNNISIKAGDTRPLITGNVEDSADDGNSWGYIDLTNATSLKINIVDSSGAVIVSGGTCTITDPVNGGFSYALASGLAPGNYKVEFPIVFSDGGTQTPPNGDMSYATLYVPPRLI